MRQTVVSLLTVTLFALNHVQAATSTWNTTAASADWLTAGNWTGGVPGTLDVGSFAGTNPSNASVGLSDNVVVGSISLSGTSSNITLGSIGNGGGASRILTLNGAIVNSVANTILSNTTSSATTLAIVPVVGGNKNVSQVTLGNTANIIQVSSANTISISPVIGQTTAGSSLTLQGGGKLTLSAVNTYTGATTIKGGTLKLDVAGSLASTGIIVGDAGSSGAILDATTKTGGFTVASGQTVSGVGTIQGSTTFQSGSNLAPGNSGAGVFNNLGNIALQAGSSFNLDLTGAALGTGYDQLNVTGSVTLGGLLAVNMGAFVPTNGSLFFVLANDGVDAIAGTFSNAPTNGSTYTLGGRQFQISYFGNHTGSGAGTFTGGNDVVLMAVPEPTAALLGGIGVLFLLRRRRSA